MENIKGFENKPEGGTKNTEYFARLAQRLTSAFKLHESEGKIWEEKDGKRDWRNVSEHCLVVTARAQVLGEMLGLSEQRIIDLMYAGVLHDFSKRKEKELKVPEGGITWEQYEKEISEYSIDQITKHGFSQEIAELAESVGHGPLLKIEEMLKDPDNLNEYDVAYLAMHYIDNYSIGSEWVKPTDGMTNEIDRRTLKDKNNNTLKNLQEDGKKIFAGRNYTEIMQETGHDIEKLLVKIIKRNKNLDIEPLRLPEYIDEEIKKKIIS